MLLWFSACMLKLAPDIVFLFFYEQVVYVYQNFRYNNKILTYISSIKNASMMLKVTSSNNLSYFRGEGIETS